MRKKHIFKRRIRKQWGAKPLPGPTPGLIIIIIIIIDLYSAVRSIVTSEALGHHFHTCPLKFQLPPNS